MCTVTLSLYLIIFVSMGATTHRRISQEWSGSGCPPPELSFNGSLLPAVYNIRHQNIYSEITEVRFAGEVGPSVVSEKQLCKIKCIGGEWVGPLCQNKNEGGHFQPLLRRCRLEYIPSNLIITYKNITISTENLTFPHGALILARCKQIGVYKLLGESPMQCLNGVWSPRIPACIPTTIITNFTEDSPPTVLIRIPAGSASVEPSGDLAVFPGSIVHLECLFSRRLGNPEWTWTSTFRQYLTGWAIATDEREWKYRLSIYYSKAQDSGVYTCATPRGVTNSINMQVIAVHCDPLEVNTPYLSSRIEGSRLGHKAIFQCPTGFSINGTSNLTCQASGKWSSEVPTCVPVVCPKLEVDDPHLTLVEHNTSYGGRAVFRCSWGYRITGPPGLECEKDGKWSGKIPSCKMVKCPPPLAPINGRLRLAEEGPWYKVGTVVQFSCNERHQLIGETSVVCTETGFWSHPPPFCKARCSYPGDPINGRVAPVKFWYEPGDKLQVTCNAGFVIKLQDMPQCQSDGTWSLELPECKSYQDV